MKSLIVAKYTFKELLKSKIVVASLWFGFAVLVLTYVTSEYSYGNPAKIAVDFGLSASSLVCLAISVFMGVSLISDEIESRTIYLSLSRPISRSQFLIGKILGMSLILLLNILIVNTFSSAIYIYFGGELSLYILYSIIFVFFEALVVLLIVILFSLITNKTLTIINTALLTCLGHWINQTFETSYIKNRPELESFVRVIANIIPNFDKINIKNYFEHTSTISFSSVSWPLIYIVCYTLILVLITTLIFNKKELD